MAYEVSLGVGVRRRWEIVIVALVLELLADVKAVTFPPNIYLQPALNMVYKINESVKLPCVADGNPPPTYKWFRQGNEFNPSANANRYAQWPNTGTLIINSPQVDDDGMYQCQAINKFGTSVSYQVNLRRGDLQPFATTTPTTYTRQVGTSLRLACNPPQSYPPATIYWAMQQLDSSLQPLMYNSRVTQDLDGNLYFVNLLSNDTNAGTQYVCVVNNEYLRLLMTGSQSIVTVTGSQPVGSKPQLLYSSAYAMTGLVNMTVMFKCIFSGWPTPVISWIYMTDSTPFPTGTQLDSFGQTLIFPSVQMSHAGTYQCRGRNDQSQYYASAQFSLTVESAPFWIVQPMDTTARVGDTIVFRCVAGGTPSPTIYWFVNGVPIAQAPPNANRVLQNGMVYFSNVQLTDVTNLQCNATNKHGYVFADVFLNVLNVPPSFVRPPLAQTYAAEQQSVTITCQTYSPPPTYVVWMRGAQQITGGRFTIQSNGDLYIPTLSVTDSGVYTCIVSNDYGNVSASGQLTVRRATQIMLAPTNARIYQNDQVKFQCTAIADPLTISQLQFLWMKDGDAINFAQSSRIQLNFWDTSIIISAAMYLDTGQYTCTATNGIDQVSADASLVVQAVPLQAQNLKVDCTLYKLQRQAVVSWDAGSDNYAPVLVFIIEYNTSSSPDKWYPANVLTNITQTVQGSRSARVQLQPYSVYSFRVSSRNVVGQSDPSPPTTTSCTTDPDLPYTNPQNVRGFGNPYVNVPNIWIQWTPMPPIQYNGPQLQYLVYMRCLECADMGVPYTYQFTFPVENPTLFSYTVTQFVYGTQTKQIPQYRWFKVMVQAKNSMGVSLVYPTEANAYSSEADPPAGAAPQQLSLDSSGQVTSSSVALMWNAPSDITSTTITGCWRGYRVEWWVTGDANPDANKRFQDFMFPLGGGVGGTNCYEQHPNAILTPLSQSTGRKRRDVRLQTVDSFGVEDENLALAQAAGNGEQTQTQTKTRRKRQALTAPAQVTTAPPQTGSQLYRAVLTNLPGAASLTIAVRVLTMFYAGPASSTVQVTTLTGVPGPCNDFQVTQVGQNYLMLSWAPPLASNGDIVGYQLATQIVVGLTLSNMEVYPALNGSATLSGSVSGLRPNTTYRVYVWAFTSAGNGEMSYLEVPTAQPGPPSPPTYAVTAIGTTWLNVSFAPSQSGVPGNVYYAQWRRSGRLQWLMSATATTQRWVYIPDLQAGMTYNLRMVAENGAGNEAAAAAISVTTAGESPATITASTAGWLILLVLLLVTLIAGVFLLCFFKRKRDERERQLFAGQAGAGGGDVGAGAMGITPQGASEQQGAYGGYSGYPGYDAQGYGGYPGYDAQGYPGYDANYPQGGQGQGYGANYPAAPGYDQYGAPLPGWLPSGGDVHQPAYASSALGPRAGSGMMGPEQAAEPVYGRKAAPEPVYGQRPPSGRMEAPIPEPVYGQRPPSGRMEAPAPAPGPEPTYGGRRAPPAPPAVEPTYGGGPGPSRRAGPLSPPTVGDLSVSGEVGLEGMPKRPPKSRRAPPTPGAGGDVELAQFNAEKASRNLDTSEHYLDVANNYLVLCRDEPEMGQLYTSTALDTVCTFAQTALQLETEASRHAPQPQPARTGTAENGKANGSASTQPKKPITQAALRCLATLSKHDATSAMRICTQLRSLAFTMLDDSELSSTASLLLNNALRIVSGIDEYRAAREDYEAARRAVHYQRHATVSAISRSA